MKNMMVNKVMITLHIVFYLAIIIVNASQFLFINDNLKESEISTVCLLVVYSVCSLIFGLIVNTIVTRIVNATNSEEIELDSEMDLRTGSVRGGSVEAGIRSDSLASLKRLERSKDIKEISHLLAEDMPKQNPRHSVNEAEETQ